MQTNIKKMGNIKDKRVVLLQSGGLDSCFLASLFSYLGFDIHHVFVDYGQNSKEQEKKAVEAIVKEYGGTLHCVELKLPWLKDSTVLVEDQEVKNADVPRQFGAVKVGVYVPMRNHVLLSIAGSLAESLDIQYIASGIDGKQNIFGKPITGTPDKHPNFVKALENSLSEGSVLKHINGKEFTILCPLVGVEKYDTIAYGTRFLNTKWELSWSCYNNSKEPCGTCGACVDRQMCFDYLGLKDPAIQK